MHVPDTRPVGPSIRGRIYRSLYRAEGFCSKQSLAAACGISMPTLYQNLNELMALGLVRYSGEEQSTGGRKARGLEIVPDARIAAGISVTEHHLRLVAVDLRLKELAYEQVAYDPTGQSASPAELLEAFVRKAGLEGAPLLGVGITVPGLLSEDRQALVFAPTLGASRPLSLQALTEGLPGPVFVENDGTASGHAEYIARGGRGTMVYLSLENGVGGAVLMDGLPYEGDHGRSGEFGHICVEPGGIRCHCGRQGCLEAYCSARRVSERFGVSLETFFDGVAAHRPEYEALLYDMLRHLAVAIGAIRMTLDCDIVLGGAFAEHLQPHLDTLRRYVEAGSPFGEKGDFVQLSTLRRHIAPTGAALHFIQEFVRGV